MQVSRPITVLLTGAVALGVAACGSGGTPAKKAATSGPVTQVEVNPPGDIPDNQAFVPVALPGFSVTVPEGWARTKRGAAIVFADKYNSITIDSVSAPAAPTVASARAREIPSVRAASAGFSAGSVGTVRRKAGAALLINYKAKSPVNPVTGKVAVRAVERYEFWRAGREVVLTLAAPVGSDNVDPWRIVTDSFRWTAR